VEVGALFFGQSRAYISLGSEWTPLACKLSNSNGLALYSKILDIHFQKLDLSYEVFLFFDKALFGIKHAVLHED